MKTEGNPKIKSPCLFTIAGSAKLKLYTEFALIVRLSTVSPRYTCEEAKWIIIVINRTTCHFVQLIYNNMILNYCNEHIALWHRKDMNQDDELHL